MARAANSGGARAGAVPVVVDTREQRPWSFPGFVSVARVAALDFGDYAIDGHESRFAVERKSGADLVSTLLSGWDRFRRELERGEGRVVVVAECDMEWIRSGEFRFTGTSGRRVTDAPPAAILERVVDVSSGFGVPLLFAGSREGAADLAGRLLRARFREFRRMS